MRQTYLSDLVEVRPSKATRGFEIVLGVGFSVFSASEFLSDRSPGWLLFVALGPALVLGALRTRVEIYRSSDELVSLTAFTKTQMKLSAVENVRPLRKRGAGLTLVSGESVIRQIHIPLGREAALSVRIGEGGPGPTTVVTGLSSDGLPSRSKVYELATLIGVPVLLSRRRMIRDARPEPQIRPWWVIRAFVLVVPILAIVVFWVNMIAEHSP